jgi:uncharacterized membrane protein YccF (DUF307 family)
VVVVIIRVNGLKALQWRQYTVDPRPCGKSDIGTSGFGVMGNILWFILAGLWIALGHVGLAICSFISIIGIPFGIQHLKLVESVSVDSKVSHAASFVYLKRKRRAASVNSR